MLELSEYGLHVKDHKNEHKTVQFTYFVINRLFFVQLCVYTASAGVDITSSGNITKNSMVFHRESC